VGDRLSERLHARVVVSAQGRPERAQATKRFSAKALS
jgi:hypothetical protein